MCIRDRNTTVNDQLFEGQTCDLTANRIERGQGDSPVSYTHLDVYKRQSLVRIIVSALLCGAAAFACTLLPVGNLIRLGAAVVVGAGAVSYTHLDVYKRQVSISSRVAAFSAIAW